MDRGGRGRRRRVRGRGLRFQQGAAPAPKLTGSLLGDGHEFGASIAVSANKMAAGAAGDDGAGADAGAVYVFASSSPWAEQGRLTAPDAEAGDKFGASVSIDGNTLAVGAPGDDDLGFESGAVWLYTVTGSLWSMEDKPPASDGETLLVGAFGQDPSGTLSGAAYVFVRTGSNWNQQAKLEPADGTAIDMFGSTVAIDGDTAAIASLGDSDGGGMSGSVYVFKRAGTLWTQEAKLTASDA
ncbi:MAG: FG-GAP repeat protein, partial [SAR202 cluster bacterium]|nr:FG-GAP repeat protein [SAR202 cluster bacterium]